MTERSNPNVFAPFVGICALAIGVFHLLNVAGVLLLSTMEIRIIHLAVMMVLLFLGLTAKDSTSSSIGRAAPALVAIVVGVYFLSRWKAIALSGGDTSHLDLYVGGVLLLLVLEATRRGIGLVLVVAPEAVEGVTLALTQAGEAVHLIGDLTTGEGPAVRYRGSLA